MRTRTRLRLSVCIALLAAPALVACSTSGGASPPSLGAAAPMAAPVALPAAASAAAPASSVQVTVQAPFAQPQPIVLTGTHAFAFVRDTGAKIVLIDGDVASSCAEQPHAFGGDMGADNYALSLEVESALTPGGTLTPGHSLYYPRNGRTTNSGNGPRPELTLKINQVDAQVVAGEIHGSGSPGSTIEGTFVAQRCP